MSPPSHRGSGSESGLGRRLTYGLMALQFRVRDLVLPRDQVLAEVGIEPGDTVVDFGCGPGGYVEATSRRVGGHGCVVAVDCNPLALQSVKRLASRRGLANVKTVLTSGSTELPDQSVDVCLMYDMFHDLDDPSGVLAEVHRVLKDGGVLSFSDHHLDSNGAIDTMVRTGLFAHTATGARTITFVKR